MQKKTKPEFRVELVDILLTLKSLKEPSRLHMGIGTFKHFRKRGGGGGGGGSRSENHED